MNEDLKFHVSTKKSVIHHIIIFNEVEYSIVIYFRLILQHICQNSPKSKTKESTLQAGWAVLVALGLLEEGRHQLTRR